MRLRFLKPIPTFVLGSVLIALLVLFGPVLFGHSILYYRDILHNYYPHLEFMKTSLWRGDWPFWNPYLFNGTPLMAGLEPPLFYPLGWMFFFLPFQFALALNLCLHHILAAIGILALGGQYRWSWAARGLAAFCFSFGGVMIAMNNFHPLQNAVVWMPLLIWAAHRVLHEQSLRPLCWFSMAYAMQILSGHLEVVYFTSLLILAYTALFLRQRAKSTIWLGFAVLLGILLSALQLLPSLSYLPLSVRQGGMEFSNTGVWSYHPWLSTLFILPEQSDNVFRGFTPYFLFGEKNFSYAPFFTSSYMGLFAWLGVGLVLWQLPRHSQRRIVIFWLCALIVSLLMAYGQYLPVYHLAANLPGLSFFRYPTKFLIVTALAFSMLAGWGLDAIETDDERFKRLFKLIVLYTLGFGLAAAVTWLTKTDMIHVLSEQAQAIRQLSLDQATEWSQGFVHVLLLQFGRQLLLCGLLSGLCWLLIRKRWKVFTQLSLLFSVSLLDLLLSGTYSVWLTSRDFTQLQVPAVDFFKSRQLGLNSQERYLLAAKTQKIPSDFRLDIDKYFYLRANVYNFVSFEDNHGMNGGFRSAYGLWPAYTYQSNLINLIYQNGLSSREIQLRNILESISSVRYLLFNNPSHDVLSLYDSSPAYRQLAYFAEPSSYVFENLNYLSRARFYYQSAVIKDNTVLINAFTHPDSMGFKFKEQVLLLEDDALKQAREQIPSQEAKNKKWTSPQFIADSNNLVELSFETNTSGYLVLADQYLPGWKAYDNGVETPILRANFLHRAVRVGPGQHRIRFEYQPPGLLVGLIVTGISLLLWLTLLFLSSRQVRQKHRIETVKLEEVVNGG